MQLSVTLIACCVSTESQVELLFGSSSDLLNSHFVLALRSKPTHGSP